MRSVTLGLPRSSFIGLIAILAISPVAAQESPQALVSKSWENWQKDNRGLVPANLSVSVNDIAISYDPLTAKTTLTMPAGRVWSEADMTSVKAFWPDWVNFALKNHSSLTTDLERIKQGLTFVPQSSPPPPPPPVVANGCGQSVRSGCGWSFGTAQPCSGAVSGGKPPQGGYAMRPVLSPMLVASSIKSPVFNNLAAYIRSTSATTLEVSVSTQPVATELDRVLALDDALLARDLYARGLHEDAAHLAEAAIIKNPDSVLGWTMRAICAIQLNDRGIATESTREARHALMSDRSKRSELYRQLERVQGHARANFESELLRVQKPIQRTAEDRVATSGG